MIRTTVRAAALAGTALLAATPAAAQDKPQTYVAPYVELNQTVVADLEGTDDAVTYTTVAAGVDAGIQTRRTQAEVSYRYEHRFSWNDDIGDNDLHTGLARALVQVTPQLSLEGGALATRSRSDIRGAAPLVLQGDVDNIAKVYSLYAGPTVSTMAGPISVTGSLFYGYTKVETPNSVFLEPGQPRLDYFDASNSLVGSVSAGVAPGVVLPVGLTASAGYERDWASQLKQRYEQQFIRVDALLPVSRTVAVRGGVGYEKIETSQRDALTDATGAPVLDEDGRFVTDTNAPRRLAYQTDGLIYDAGVVWRPNARTELTANVGHRYGGTSYTGTLSWQWQRDVALNVAVYDGEQTFGRQLRQGLRSLPTDFVNLRDVFGQQYNGCVFSGAPGRGAGGCLNQVFQSISTASYRARGVDAILVATEGRTSYGVGVGYANRHLHTPRSAPGLQLIGLDDESWYGQVFWSRALSRDSNFDANFYLNWYDSELPGNSPVLAAGATANYFRSFGRLGTLASLGLYSFSQDGQPDQLSLQALLGARYQF